MVQGRRGDTGETQTVSDNKCGSVAKVLPVYMYFILIVSDDIYTFLEPTWISYALLHC